MKKLLVIAAAIFAAAFCVMPAAAAREPLKALVVTGQNNHNWPVSHVVLKQILENSGLFSVDCAVSPAKGEDMSGFSCLLYTSDAADD